jgi:hypothetical protein
MLRIRRLTTAVIQHFLNILEQYRHHGRHKPIRRKFNRCTVGKLDVIFQEPSQSQRCRQYIGKFLGYS